MILTEVTDGRNPTTIFTVRQREKLGFTLSHIGERENPYKELSDHADDLEKGKNKYGNDF